jgi:hypothetical protein
MQLLTIKSSPGWASATPKQKVKINETVPDLLKQVFIVSIFKRIFTKYKISVTPQVIPGN